MSEKAVGTNIGLHERRLLSLSSTCSSTPISCLGPTAPIESMKCIGGEIRSRTYPPETCSKS